MTKTRRLIALPLLVALAACGDKNAEAEGERKTAAGEVLGGSVSDDMLPLDSVTSRSPPLREDGDGASKRPAGQSTNAPADRDAAADAAQPAEEAAAAPPEE